MKQTISDAAALRVALASKQLPSVDLRSLLGLLIQHLGEPLTEIKLVDLSPKAFRVMVASLCETISRKEVSNALSILCNPEIGDDVPKVPAFNFMDTPSLRVAMTSNQGNMLNGHYGSCIRVLIYDVSATQYQLVDVRDMPSDSKGEERAIAMLDKIRDCQMLFTLSIGGPAAARVTRANIHPIKKPAATSADLVLSELSNVIATSPPPWIRRFLGVNPMQTELALEECYE
ncbi:NifB/NifX family molybdenum-iron cluster-binding protein [Vibrio sp. RC27]